MTTLDRDAPRTRVANPVWGREGRCRGSCRRLCWSRGGRPGPGPQHGLSTGLALYLLFSVHLRWGPFLHVFRTRVRGRRRSGMGGAGGWGFRPLVGAPPAHPLPLRAALPPAGSADALLTFLPAFEAGLQVPVVCAEASRQLSSRPPPWLLLPFPRAWAQAQRPGRRENKPALFPCQGTAGLDHGGRAASGWLAGALTWTGTPWPSLIQTRTPGLPGVGRVRRTQGRELGCGRPLLPTLGSPSPFRAWQMLPPRQSTSFILICHRPARALCETRKAGEGLRPGSLSGASTFFSSRHLRNLTETWLPAGVQGPECATPHLLPLRA